MLRLSHPDEVVARRVFPLLLSDFGDWTRSKEKSFNCFSRMAEATDAFVALCAALKSVGGSSNAINETAGHACQLIRFCESTF